MAVVRTPKNLWKVRRGWFDIIKFDKRLIFRWFCTECASALAYDVHIPLPWYKQSATWFPRFNMSHIIAAKSMQGKIGNMRFAYGMPPQLICPSRQIWLVNHTGVPHIHPRTLMLLVNPPTIQTVCAKQHTIFIRVLQLDVNNTMVEFFVCNCLRCLRLNWLHVKNWTLCYPWLNDMPLKSMKKGQQQCRI